jgi:hypothetical protein
MFAVAILSVVALELFNRCTVIFPIVASWSSCLLHRDLSNRYIVMLAVVMLSVMLRDAVSNCVMILSVVAS